MEYLSKWFDLTGQAALVTGASRGIGKALAMALAAAGAEVACLATRVENAAGTVEEIRKGGGRAIALGGDVSLEEDVSAAVAATLGAFSRLDILVNNAGFLLEKPFAEISLGEWNRLMDVNVNGMFLFARAAAYEMVRLGRGGSIVNVGSTFGKIGVTSCAAYCTSKAAIDGLTRSLAVEYARQGVRVNCIAPGYIATDLNQEYLRNEKARKVILSKIPLRRVGQPGELGPLVVFLCARGGGFITGQTIYADGGEVIAW